MKTFQTLDGKFVNEDPGLENTIFGYDKNGTPIVLDSILYWDYSPSTGYLHRIDEYNCNYTNQYMKNGYVIVSPNEAEKISKIPNKNIYGQWRPSKRRLFKI